MDASSEQELTVSGMTCGHCAQSLTRALSTLGGVGYVDVDVNSGWALLRSTCPLSTEALASAVSEAGFELISVRERVR